MKNIDVYYKSLKQVHEEILAWEPPKPRAIQRLADWLVGIFAVLLALSLIPVIAAAIMLASDQLPIILGPIDTTDGTFTSFGFLWLATIIPSGILFALSLWINSKVDQRSQDPEDRKPLQSLSPEQYSFISVYEAYSELKVYFVSHIDQHVRNAFDALVRVLPRRRFVPFTANNGARYREIERLALISEIEGDISAFPAAEIGIFGPSSIRGLRSGLPTDVSTARAFLRTFGNYGWFNIDSENKQILQALISFTSKVPPRIMEQEDLDTVLQILEDFSRFLYAFLPEHKAHIEPDALETLHADGLAHLEGFVEEVNGLPEYTFEDEAQERERISPAPSVIRRIWSLQLVRVLVRFAVWFVLIAILASVAVLLFNQILQLTADTMATLIIGASITGAAALTAFNPSLKPHREDHDDQAKKSTL